MNFFESQEKARHKTSVMLVLFTLAVLCLVIATNLLVMAAFGYFQTAEKEVLLQFNISQMDWEVFGITTAIVLLVILSGSIYKTILLSGGGVTLAESLGGRQINHYTTDPDERKTLNVVEEMAIASGMPVPLVYLLPNEEAINAFAAGFKPGDAVIGVTRGCIKQLNRDELQGVVAHEFSHILNGDMRLNMRLISVLHGILLIGLIGYQILRITTRRSSKNSGPIIGLGFGLVALGYSGTFFGNLIKASVSRQREFLADASAVQFTRNPDGITGALKKIGGYSSGSKLSSPGAHAMSHMYFTSGIKMLFQSFMSTHPPLEVRIKRIDSNWEAIGKSVIHEKDKKFQPESMMNSFSLSEKMENSAIASGLSGNILEKAGQTTPEQLAIAVDLMAMIPESIKAAVKEPYSVRAVIFGLVINDEPDTRKRQLEHINKYYSLRIYNLVCEVHQILKKLDIRLRLPIIDLALPTLRLLSNPQYNLFKQNLQFLIKIDSVIDLFEWSLQKILFHFLDPYFGHSSTKDPGFVSLKASKKHINILISMLIHACVKDKSAVSEAFKKAEEILAEGKLEFIQKEQTTLKKIEIALDQLSLLKPMDKYRTLKVCLTVITMDQDYSPYEVELMRAVASVLDCPLPPSPLE